MYIVSQEIFSYPKIKKIFSYTFYGRFMLPFTLGLWSILS